MSVVPTDDPRFVELARYVRFDAADAARIAALRPAVEPHFASIADAFYDRIREHAGAHAVLKDEDQVRRLMRSMVVWLEALFSGDYGDAHFERGAKVGQVHVRVGLPVHYVHTAMALIRARLIAAIGVLPERAEALASLNKLIDLELAVMDGAYCEHHDARLARLVEDRSARGGGAMTRALERARVLVVGIDHQLRVVSFNREAERTTGWARDEVATKPAAPLLFAGEHAKVVERRFASLLPDDDAFFDAVLETRQGHHRDVRWQLMRAQASGANAGAEPTEDVAYMLIGHDVTDELALAERTRRAERLAAVGTLAAGLAHEIRNPLNGAHLHLTLAERALKKSAVVTDAAESLGTASSEIQRLGHLVTDFLQFARPQKVELTPTSLGTIAQRALGLLQPEADRRRVQVALTLPPTDVVVMGDAARLEQVILNLLRNAIEASEATTGPRGVQVRVFRTPAGGTVEVEDDGPGLPSPDAPIFDAFFTTKPTGTGLGLSIAHRITEDHGGRLSVESTKGRTVFRLALPRADGAARADRGAADVKTGERT